jgi:hypothetical protein
MRLHLVEERAALPVSPDSPRWIQVLYLSPALFGETWSRQPSVRCAALALKVFAGLGYSSAISIDSLQCDHEVSIVLVLLEPLIETTLHSQ